MKLSATLVAVLVAIPYLLSPLQVAMGNWADRHLIWGRHRSPWIVLGGLMASFGSYLTAHAAYLLTENLPLTLLASLAAFVGQAVGSIASGLARDIALPLTGNSIASYVTVFGLEIVGLLLAIWLFQRISAEEFQRDAELRIHEVLVLAGD